ncbi:unnamed protein product [Schistosoma turkestanicum]|nr:unnamed protein product [Schistosoma turkestanicum]
MIPPNTYSPYFAYSVVGASTVTHDDKDGKHENEEDEEAERGMKPVFGTLCKSMMIGIGKILKTIDKYSRKDDLDKKLLEVAKISELHYFVNCIWLVGRRMEKRHEYYAKKLDDMLNYSTS